MRKGVWLGKKEREKKEEEKKKKKKKKRGKKREKKIGIILSPTKSEVLSTIRSPAICGTNQNQNKE